MLCKVHLNGPNFERNLLTFTYQLQFKILPTGCEGVEAVVAAAPPAPGQGAASAFVA